MGKQFPSERLEINSALGCLKDKKDLIVFGQFQTESSYVIKQGGEDKRKKNTQSHCTTGEPVHSALPASVPCLWTEKAGNVFLNGVSRRRTPFAVNKRARLSVRSNVRQSFSKHAKEKPIF